MTIPNWLTLARILMIPICIVFYYLPYQWSYWGASIVFILAAVTDWMDGYLARKLNQTTPFGAFIDPVADKLIVMAALVMLVEEHNTLWMTLPAITMVGREIVISALREWMAEIGKRASVAVNMIGKYKTTFQMIAIAVLLSQPPGTVLTYIGLVILQIAAALTIWSMLVYLKAAWADLKEPEK